MRTRRISQLTETTADVHADDQITLVNSSPLQNYRVTVNAMSELFASSLWLRNELDGGFAQTIPVQNVDSDIGAGDLTGESLHDGDWGATNYDFIVRGDGTKDRLSSYPIQQSATVTWGDNGEPEWWKVEGPNAIDVSRMRYTEIGSNSSWTGGSTTSGMKNREAFRRLLAAPNTYNDATSTWSTASYVRSQNQAISGNPFTMCMFWGQPTDINFAPSSHVKNYETLWAAGARNHSNISSPGWRLMKFNESLFFHIGGGTVGENDYPVARGFLDIAYGRSANTVTRTGHANQSYIYQVPHTDAGGTTTTHNQLMDPVNVPGDIYMYYHITVVYNGGPIGYHDMSDFSASAQETMATNIQNSFKFYQTNLRNGYVTEIPWVMCGFHRLFGDATNNVASSPGGNTESANSFGMYWGVGDNRHQASDQTRWTIFGDTENAYCARANWVSTHFTTSALTQAQLQGNANYLGGFALDPLTYASVNGLDHTNTGIYNPSYHPNKLDGVTMHRYQNQASGASSSAEFTKHNHFGEPSHQKTITDFTEFSNGYPGDS